jgi:hypothetical protein
MGYYYAVAGCKILRWGDFMNDPKIELVRQLFAHIENGDNDKAGAMLADDFKFSGPTPDPVDKKGFLDLHKALVSSMPDWSFNARDFRESGDFVTLKAKVSGTQTRELNIPFLGIRSARATNTYVLNPEEKVEIGFDDNKISSIKVEKVVNGGVAGILSQLGIEMPVPAKMW